MVGVGGLLNTYVPASELHTTDVINPSAMSRAATIHVTHISISRPTN